MKNHKVLIILSSLLVIVCLSVFFFHDQIFQKGANLALNLLSDEYDAKISKTKINLSEGKFNFSFKASNAETEKKLASVEEIKLDFNRSGFSFDLDTEINNVDIVIRPELLEAKSDKKDGSADSFNGIPFLNLGIFTVNNVSLNVIDPGMTGSIESFNLNFPEGSGSIQSILANSKSQGLKFLDINDIKINFNSDELTKDDSVSIIVSNPELKISDELIAAFKELMPESSTPATKPSETPVSMLKSITIKNTDFSFIGKQMTSGVDEIFVNFENNGPTPLDQLSKIRIDNVNIRLQKQGIKSDIKNILVSKDEGKARLKEISSSLLSQTKKFLSLEELTISFDPEKLTSNDKPSLKLAVIELNLDVSKALLEALKGNSPTKSTSPPNLPVIIERILVGDSKIRLMDYPGIGDQKQLTIQGIFGSIYHITLEPETPLATYNFNASFEGDTKMIVKGRMDLAHSPIQWSANWKVFDFDMDKLNPELRERIPLTFKEGTFNVFGEAIKKDENIVGYTKLFLKDAQYLGNKKEFKGIRHFFAEIFATGANWLLENDRKNSVATRIPFQVIDGKLSTDNSKAAWRAIEHGFFQNDLVEPGIDRKYQLKQAQEEKDSSK